MTYTFPISRAFPTTLLRRELDRFIDDALAVRPAANGWQPTASVCEEAASYTFALDLPGVAPDKVDVLAEDGTLTVKGVRELPRAPQGARVHLAEQPGGAFVRRFRLPKAADLQSVTAEFAHGVLTIQVAKIIPAQPRRVPVTVAVPKEPTGPAAASPAEPGTTGSDTASPT